MEAAAGIGHGKVFHRVGEELARSRWSGQAPWDALTTLADEVGVPRTGRPGRHHAPVRRAPRCTATLRAHPRRCAPPCTSRARRTSCPNGWWCPASLLGVVFIALLVTARLRLLTSLTSAYNPTQPREETHVDRPPCETTFLLIKAWLDLAPRRALGSVSAEQAVITAAAVVLRSPSRSAPRSPRTPRAGSPPSVNAGVGEGSQVLPRRRAAVPRRSSWSSWSLLLLILFSGVQGGVLPPAHRAGDGPGGRPRSRPPERHPRLGNLRSDWRS